MGIYVMKELIFVRPIVTSYGNPPIDLLPNSIVLFLHGGNIDHKCVNLFTGSINITKLATNSDKNSSKNRKQWQKQQNQSPMVFYKKNVKYFAKFIGKHLC